MDMIIFSQLSPFAKLSLLFLCAALGLVLGSGLSCLAQRLAHGQKWSRGRSVCPKCGHALGVGDLVPVFSWLLLRGKCRYCKAPISVRNPISELCLAMCNVALLLRFGLTLQTLSCTILCSCLFCLTLVDLDIQIIPNRFLIIPACARIAQLCYEQNFPQLGTALLTGLGLSGAVLLLTALLDRVLKKESMGGGDIKLLFVLGMYFDFRCCFLLLILACVLGLIFAGFTHREKPEIPFGPALSIAAFVTLLIGESLVNWYLRLFF